MWGKNEMIRYTVHLRLGQYFIYGIHAPQRGVFHSLRHFDFRVLCKFGILVIGEARRTSLPSASRDAHRCLMCRVTLESILRSQNPDPSRKIIAVSQHHCRYRSV